MTSIPQIWNSTKNAYEGINAFALSNVDGTNAMTSGQIYNLANLTRNICPSGCLTVGDLDYTYMNTNPNKIKFLTENVALINGYKDTIPATTIITINTPPLDVPRNDLVFREMYLDATTGIPTFKFRIVNGVDFTTYPEGINQTALVKAQGSSSSDTSYTYSLSSTDKGLYVAGDGSNGAKTALGSLDGYSYAICMFNVKRRSSSGMMETNEYDKVSSLGNIALVKAKSNQQRVSHTGDSISTKIEGKTLVNLLGDAGNCEDISKWSGNASGVIDTTIKLFGNSSIKYNPVGSAFYTIIDILCDQTHKYLVSGYVYISAYTSGVIDLSCRDYGSPSNVSSLAFDSTKLNQWQRKSGIITGKANGGMRLYIGNSNSIGTATYYKDGIMLYDLTQIYGAGNEPTDIPTLERALPYVNGVKSASAVGIKSCGKNLFNADNFLGSYYINADGSLASNSNYYSYRVKVKQSTSYTVKNFEGSILTTFLNYETNVKSLISVSSSAYNSVYGTFTTPTNCDYVVFCVPKSRMYQLQLEESATATAYESYSESGIILPTEIGDLKQIGSVKDQVDLQTGDWTKRIEQKVLVGSDVVAVDDSQYTNVAYAQIWKPSNMDGATNAYTGLLEGYTTYITSDYDNISHIGQVSITNCIWVGFPKGTTLAQAQTALTGRKLNYILATPIVTNIKDKFDGRMYLNSGYNGISVDNVSKIDGGVVSVPNLVTNGDFSNGTTGWGTSTITGFTSANNEATFTATAQAGQINQLVSVGTIVGNKYYMRTSIKATSNQVGIGFLGVPSTYHSGSGNYENLSYVYTATATNHYMRVMDNSTSGWSLISTKNIMLYNLTATFGAGNEPDTAWCDKYLTFGTNYALYAPSLTTALKVVNDGGDKFNSVQGNVGIISANKYRSDKLYSLMYRLAEGDYTYPDTTITAGTQTAYVKDSASVGSITLADSDVMYKKNGDGARLYRIITSMTDSNVIGYGYTKTITLSSTDYDYVQIGDVYSSGTTSAGYAFKIIAKSTSNLVTVQNVGTTQLSMGNLNPAYLYTNASRVDNLLSDIVDKKDVVDNGGDLRHQVSLVGYNYDNMLTSVFDTLIRNEL